MECAFCEATLEDPDRCVACGLGQPAAAPELASAPRHGRRGDPAGLPIALLLAGAVLSTLSIPLSVAAPGVGPLVGFLGVLVLAAAFFVPLVMILRRLDALGRGA